MINAKKIIRTSVDGHIALDPSLIANLGIKYASNIFSICQANQSDLGSGDNMALVNMPSITPGKRVLIDITANASFVDGAAASSDIDGNTFGSTASVAWANDRPFFLYLINLDDVSSNAKLAISLSPAYYTAPS